MPLWLSIRNSTLQSARQMTTTKLAQTHSAAQQNAFSVRKQKKYSNFNRNQKGSPPLFRIPIPPADAPVQHLSQHESMHRRYAHRPKHWATPRRLASGGLGSQSYSAATGAGTLWKISRLAARSGHPFPVGRLPFQLLLHQDLDILKTYNTVV